MVQSQGASLAHRLHLERRMGSNLAKHGAKAQPCIFCSRKTRYRSICLPGTPVCISCNEPGGSGV